MARKPKTQPSLEDAAPARQGRKPEAAAPPFASPSAAAIGDPAADEAGAEVPQTGPAKAPGRKGAGRKPKQATGAEVARAAPDDATAPQGQTSSHQPEAEAIQDPIGNEAATAAAASRTGAAAGSDPALPDLGSGRSAAAAARPFPEAGAPISARPAAHWDRATDRVRFDWPSIERTAAQKGPNQGMAKLLVAARAEGAHSRWPL